MTETFPSGIFFTWDIHYKCDYYCTYCFLHAERETADIEAVYLAPQRWIEIWQDIYKRYGSCHVHITGGEPFVYPDFIDLISEISKIHSFEFSTNFSFDTKEFSSKISTERVKISPSFHPEFTSPEAFIEKYIGLKERGYLLGAITAVAYPPFLSKISSYKSVFEKGQSKVIVYPYRGRYEDRLFPAQYNEDEREILKLLGTEVAAKVSSELLGAYSPADKEASMQKLEKKTCRMGQRYAKIMPNGEVFRCCAAVWNSAKSWPNWGGLGNIADNTFSLLDKPKLCGRQREDDCVCYKAMIVGEEEKWLKHWSNVKIFLDNLEKESILDAAKLLRDKGNLEEAIDKLREFLSKEHSAEALILLGELYIVKRDYGCAEKTLHFALEKTKGRECLPWIYRCLGRLNRELIMEGVFNAKPAERHERFVSAIDYLEKTIKLTEGNLDSQDKVWAIYEKAYLYYLEKNYELARMNIDLISNQGFGNECLQELSGKIESLRGAIGKSIQRWLRKRWLRFKDRFR